jgi:hypothetical protein
VDFVVKLRGKDPMAIECKWRGDEFDSKGIGKFQELHPKGKNILISSDATAVRTKVIDKLEIIQISLVKRSNCE